MAVPQDFVALCAEIKQYRDAESPSAYKSESFGGYTYTKDKAGASWQTAFSDKLKVWRKL